MQRRGDQKKSESQNQYKRNSRVGGRSPSAQPQYQRVTSGKGGGSSVLPPPSPDSDSSSPTTQRYFPLFFVFFLRYEYEQRWSQYYEFGVHCRSVFCKGSQVNTYIFFG